MARAPLVLATLALSLGLGACGGGGSRPPPQGNPPPPPAPLPVVDPQYLVSGVSPFAAACDGQAPSGTVYINAEVEPYLAVDPLDANHMIATWQQDRWSNGSARGLMTAVSFDGGVNWTNRQPLRVSRCGGGTVLNGGDYARATDPWVTIGPSGFAFAMALSTSGEAFQAGSVNAMLVVRSLDGGRTWSDPTTLIRDGQGFFNDKNALLADRNDPNFVYAVWDRLVGGANPGGPTYFARTTNAGASWEPARAILDPGVNNQTIGNVLVQRPDGTLVNAFTVLEGINANDPDASIHVIRSLDRGATWSAPIRVADLLAVGARDPHTGTLVRDGSLLPGITAAPNGDLYVVWQDARFSNGVVDAIAISRSTDGGLTWSAPVRVNNIATNVHAFTPTVHVRPDGTVGVTYFDFRANTADTTALQTEYWLGRSFDNGATWTETRVANIFDLDSAPVANGLFLGDYMALDHRGGVFVPLFVRTNSGDLNNRTDVFVAPQVSALAAKAPPTAASRKLQGKVGSRAPRMSAQWRARNAALIERSLEHPPRASAKALANARGLAARQ